VYYKGEFDRALWLIPVIQEDHGSKTAWANSPSDPISKKLITKK
jgi:hypothetical protein